MFLYSKLQFLREISSGLICNGKTVSLGTGRLGVIPMNQFAIHCKSMDHRHRFISHHLVKKSSSVGQF